MKIAVLSGKGGTGKTFVSVNLACAAPQAVYADCDVEEPNGYLFLKPVVTERIAVSVFVPQVDASRCTGCRDCVSFCRYHALALVGERLMVFDEVCHSCGGCVLVCPQNALCERSREIGVVEKGRSDKVEVLTGCLNPGEVSGVPIIKRLMAELPAQETVIIDCPPGSACSVMESIREADFCLLITEPTQFGVHNLSMVWELVRRFGKPFAAALNKCLPGDNPAKRFCDEHGIPVLALIPYDEELGRLNSEGRVAVRENERYRMLFDGLLQSIRKEGMS